MYIYFIVVGLFHKAQPDGCQHIFAHPAETKALPHEGASALVWLTFAYHKN